MYGWGYTPLGARNPIEDDDTALPRAQSPGLPSGRGAVTQPIELPGVLVTAKRSVPGWAWALLAFAAVKLFAARG